MSSEPRGDSSIWPAIVVALVIVFAIVAGVLSVWIFLLNTQVSAIQGDLDDERVRLANEQMRRDDALRKDVRLLLDMMDKLASISEDKALTTGLSVFLTMHDLFDQLAQLSTDLQTIAVQRDILCEDPLTQGIFDVTLDVSQAHLAACAQYAEVLASDASQIDLFQEAFVNLVLALVGLDNAIASDP